jgi:hypothetical protein
MLGDFIVGFGGLACSAWRLVALCRWPPRPKTALLLHVHPQPQTSIFAVAASLAVPQTIRTLFVSTCDSYTEISDKRND